MNFSSKNQKGFSLVETLLYVALFAIIVSALAVFLATLSASRVNQQVTGEVDQQASFALRTITQSIRNATVINSPTTGATSSTLSLNTGVASTTPTVYSLTGSTLYVTEGANSAILLTNSRVTITSLIFSNLTKVGSRGTVAVDMTLKAVAASAGRAEYNYQANYHDSASLRQ